MENVLSKKVRRFLAFALAFVLAVPSVPGYQVWAANPDGKDAKIYSDSGLSEVANEISLAFGDSKVLYGSGSGYTGDITYGWGSGEAQTAFQYEGDTDKSSAEVKAVRAGSGIVELKTSSGDNSTASATADVYVYNIVTGSESSASASTAPVYVVESGKHGVTAGTTKEVAYWFSTGGDGAKTRSYGDGARITSTNNDVAEPQAAAEDKFTVTAKASGKSVITISDSKLDGSVNAASANLTVVDVGQDLRISNTTGANPDLVYKASATSEGASTLHLPMKGDYTDQASATIAIQAPDAGENDIQSIDSSLSKLAGNGTIAIGESSASSASGYAYYVITAGSAEDQKFVTFTASGSAGGKLDAETTLGTTGINVEVVEMAAPTITNTGNRTIIDQYDQETGIGLGVNYAGTSYSELGSVKEGTVYAAESAGLKILTGKISYTINSASAGGSDKTDNFLTLGTDYTGTTILSSGSADPGAYSLNAWYTAGDFVKNEDGKVAGGASYGSAVVASYPFYVVGMSTSDGEAISNVTEAGTRNAYQTTLKLGQVTSSGSATGNYTVASIKGLPEGTSVTWAVKSGDENYVTAVADAEDSSSAKITGLLDTSKHGNGYAVVTATFADGSNTFTETLRVTVSANTKEIKVWSGSAVPESTAKGDISSISIANGTKESMYVFTSSSATNYNLKGEVIKGKDFIKLASAGGSSASATASAVARIFTASASSAGAGTIRFTYSSAATGAVMMYKDVTVTSEDKVVSLTGGTVYLAASEAEDIGDSKVVESGNTDVLYEFSGTPDMAIGYADEGDYYIWSSGGNVGTAKYNAYLKNRFNSSSSWASGTVTVYGLIGKRGDKTVFSTSSASSAGVYTTELGYIDSSKTETLQLYLTPSRNPADAVEATWSVDDEAIATVSADGLVTPTGNAFGTVEVTGVYDNTETLGKNATVTLKAEITVYDFGIALKSIDAFTVKEGSTKYTFETGFTSGSEKEADLDVISRALKFSSGPVYDASGNAVTGARRTTFTFSSGTATVKAGSAGQYTTSIYVDLDATKDLGKRMKTLWAGEGHFDTAEVSFQVVDGDTVITNNAETYLFFGSDGTQSIRITRGSADAGAELVVEKKKGTIDTTNASATVSINGDVISVKPYVDDDGEVAAESFTIWVGEKGGTTPDGTTTGAGKNTFATYKVNIIEPDELAPVLALTGGETANTVTVTLDGVDKISSYLTTGEYFGMTQSYISWTSSNEKVATVEGAGTSAFNKGKITAVGAGTSVVKAVINTYDKSGGSTATGAKVVNTVTVSMNVTVADMSKVSITNIAEDGSTWIAMGDGEIEYFTPTVSGDVTGVTYEFTKSGTGSNNIEMNDDVDASVTGTSLKIASNGNTSATNIAIKVEALYGGQTVDTKTMHVAVINATADPVKTWVGGANILVTNLGADASGYKNKDLTLGDMIEGGMLVMNPNWSVKNATAKISGLGTAGLTVAVPAVYTVSTDNYTYEESGSFDAKLLEVAGAFVTYNGESYQTLTLNTSGDSKTITETFLKEKNANTGNTNQAELNTYVTNLAKKLKVTAFEVPAVNGSSVDEIKAFTSTTAFSFTINANSSYTKSTVTVSGLGFDAVITVNNVAVLSTMKINGITGEKQAKEYTAPEGVDSAYALAWSGEAKTVTLSLTATNVDSISLKSSNTSVATVASKVTGSGSFAPEITIKGYGYSLITVTANDSVKTSKSIEIFSTYPAATVNNMTLDRKMDLTSTDLEANIIEVVMAGCGYEAKSVTVTGGTGAGYFNKVADTTGKDMFGDTAFRLISNGAKPAAGTYTLEFDIFATNAINSTLGSYTIPAKATLTVTDTEFKASDFTVKQEGSPNFAYRWQGEYVDTSERVVATLLVSGKNAVPGKVTLASNSFYELIGPDGAAVSSADASDTNGYIYVGLKNTVNTSEAIKNAVKGANRKITLNITPADYSTSAIAKEVTLKASYKAPTFVASVKSATLYSNTSLKDIVETSFVTRITSKAEQDGLDWLTFALVDNKTGQKYVTTENGPFATTQAGADGNYYEDLTIALKKAGAGTYKAAVAVYDENQGIFQVDGDKEMVGKVAVTIKVDATTTKMKLVPSKKSVTLNAGGNYVTRETATTKITINGNVELAEAVATGLTITGANAKSAGVINGFNFAKANDGTITVSLKNAVAKGSYKFNVASAKLASAKAASFTVKVVTDTPAVTVRTKGSVDVLDTTTGLLITPTLKGINGTIVGVKIADADQNTSQFALVATDAAFDLDASNVEIINDFNKNYQVYLVRNTQTAAANQVANDNGYSLKNKYSVNLIYTVQSGDAFYSVPVAKPITFKVKNAKMNGVINPTMPTLTTGSTGKVKVTATYKSGKLNLLTFIRDINGTKTAGGNAAQIVQVNNKDKVKIEAQKLTDVMEGGTAVSNYGVIQVTPLNLRPGKTVSVKLQVYEYGQASDAKPATVTLKIKAPK